MRNVSKHFCAGANGVWESGGLDKGAGGEGRGVSKNLERKKEAVRNVWRKKAISFIPSVWSDKIRLDTLRIGYLKE